MSPFDREDTSVSDIIEQIIDALERADPEARSALYGSHGIDSPFHADYGFTVDWGLDPDDRAEPPEGANERLVDSRHDDDEMSVVADLPDTDGDVETRIGEGTRHLEIRDADGVIERVSLPWPAEIRTTRLNNGVLDVGLVRIDDDGDEQRSADE